MATSSFTKSYKVPKETANEFFKEMSKKGESVPYKNFHSHFVMLENDEKLKDQIQKALKDLQE